MLGGSGRGSGPGKGAGSGHSQRPGSGAGSGHGKGPGLGMGSGSGKGAGSGPGSGQGPGTGRAKGPDPGHFHGHAHSRGPWSRARRGDVRAAILLALADEPMHGYQIMQRLEERSGGAWRPSPGSVYPTLQLLEDQGMVKGEEADGRRVFALTDAGVAESAAIRERVGDSPWAAEGGEQDPRFALRQAVFQLGAAVKQVGKTGSPDLVQSSLEILREARKRIYALLAEAE
jgi:DNA-binding PadR family transcriptional regulator